jgi:hypothetical protein
MVDWLKRLVVGDGNVVLERSYTNWNTLDVAAIVAAKKRESVEESDSTPFPSDKERQE